MAELRGMLSWVFRHRARLRVIYGLAPLDPLPQIGSGESEAEAPCTTPVDEVQPAEACDRLAPGHWARRRRYVVLKPMRAHAV